MVKFIKFIAKSWRIFLSCAVNVQIRVRNICTVNKILRKIESVSKKFGKINIHVGRTIGKESILPRIPRMWTK